MQLKSIYLLLFFFFLSKSLSLAQELSPQVKREVDSLKRELKMAKHDTDKIKLNYKIATRYEISRPSFWDSLGVKARRINVPKIELNCFSQIYVIYSKELNLPKMREYLHKGLVIAEKYHYQSQLIWYYNNLAAAYSNEYDKKNTLEFSYKGLKIAEEIEDKKNIVAFYELIASCYFSLGEIDNAIKIHSKCLKINKEIKDYCGVALSLIGLGTDYNAINKYDLTTKYYLECKNYLRFLPENADANEIINSIAAAHMLKKQNDSALKYAQVAYNLAIRINDKGAIIGDLLTLARIYFEINENVKAKKTALEAYKLLQTIDFKLQIPDLTIILKKIYEAEGNYKEALKYYEVSVRAKDSLESVDNQKQALEKEFNYNLDKKESENKLLAQQNQIQSLQLSQNKYLMVGLIIVVLLLLLFGYLFLRQNKLKAQQQSSDLEQKLLRSQMNPHFIFNSLQAIQNFIMKNEKKEAFMYLSSFADITRNVLENSRMESIPLKKEISLLENYLLLQKLRFTERFEYAIHVDDAIDIENTLIAPMLSQPFIENAVEHGMYNIENDGKIDVFYTIKNDFLLMEIIDNGHGMGSSGSPGKKHQSLAMEITKERVTLMNKKSKKKTEFKINEAFPLQTERKGVKISFTIPLTMSV